MGTRETVASVLGAAGLAVDAGAAALSIVIGVPVAFAVGTARAVTDTLCDRGERGEDHSGEDLHDLGTVVELA
ncbi:hypothetical protein ACVH9Z_34905 [Rhodococcus opacus]|jgi:hypothetical protein|uniref:hypothetical protein n=1 Tax=Rhodococcus sp. IC4_135 TaxID=2715537 RepID=UPI00141DB55A|nr:hypothetical protein [Rhodococcus sp. IC4_135]